ncbi:hypothetical protein LCL97_09490 [Seohaeicola saemankumensis]|nr:hypothetical protein [Seohaeicola saemankumensis]MCA0871059.1 hypothetical protein [Seohaeicola saemankumensis]
MPNTFTTGLRLSSLFTGPTAGKSARDRPNGDRTPYQTLEFRDIAQFLLTTGQETIVLARQFPDSAGMGEIRSGTGGHARARPFKCGPAYALFQHGFAHGLTFKGPRL